VALQLYQNQMNSALTNFEQGALTGTAIALTAQALAGCTVGTFTGSVASIFLTELLGLPVLGPVGCLAGAEAVILGSLPQTILLAFISGAVEYYSAASTYSGQFQQNWKNCGN
jgi:hypothetical protein